MTFLSLSIEKSCLTQQKDLLEYQELCITNEKNQILEEMANWTAEGNDTENTYYATLETREEMFDMQVEAIEAQLETINAEIEGYEKAVQTNIKSECKIQISV